MPKDRRGEDIPSTIARSDKHARDIWKETHDSAVGTYGEGRRAHMVAFASLKHSYKKEGDRWVRKARRGPSDPQAARGPTTRKRSTDPDRAPTAGGKVAKTAPEARRKAKEAKREYARSYRRRQRSAR
ncbi:MAG TPA: ChaB family protein [Candidatus Dormibacteraeota bacterium]|jgi:cation transport regulator ChaB|nr:ChaB family protein [Candidatus Dormibacteraeota bacterium]